MGQKCPEYGVIRENGLWGLLRRSVLCIMGKSRNKICSDRLPRLSLAHGLFSLETSWTRRFPMSRTWMRVGAWRTEKIQQKSISTNSRKSHLLTPPGPIAANFGRVLRGRVLGIVCCITTSSPLEALPAGCLPGAGQGNRPICDVERKDLASSTLTSTKPRRAGGNIASQTQPRSSQTQTTPMIARLRAPNSVGFRKPF